MVPRADHVLKAGPLKNPRFTGAPYTKANADPSGALCFRLVSPYWRCRMYLDIEALAGSTILRLGGCAVPAWLMNPPRGPPFDMISVVISPHFWYNWPNDRQEGTP